MKSLVDYLHRNDWDNKLGNIIFQLDESSLEYIDDDFREFIFEAKNFQNQNPGNNRVIWTNNDGDNLRIGAHANSRRDRPVDKGGDGGKRISIQEIINMFRWAWNDIMDMNYEGKLEPYEYNQRMIESWTIECQSWLNIQNDEVVYYGARTRKMNLWAVWDLRENNYKIDIVIRTIFRGESFKHISRQERIRIDTKGNIKQIYKK